MEELDLSLVVDEMLFKIWNNWLSESEWFMLEKFAALDGRKKKKNFVYHLLEKEIKTGRAEWLLPY